MSIKNEERFITMREVERLVGFKKSWIYHLITTDQFPRPFEIGCRAVRWRLSDVKNWMDQKQRQSSNRAA